MSAAAKAGDLAALAEAQAIRDRFMPSGVSAAKGREAAQAYLDAVGDEAREAAYLSACDAALWLNVQFDRNALYRNGDMTEWFAAAGMSVADLAERGASLRQVWREEEAAKTEEEIEAEDTERAAREAEDERVEGMEDDGRYGRTLRWIPDNERFIYVRFGRMPANGRSVFGLAGEDNEDGPDEWRTACGGMTAEAGVCVLRAYRHPAVEGAYVLVLPEFSLARYHISDPDRYLNSIIPRYEEGEHPTVLRIDGSPLTIRARDGTLRCDLGSDGEYMIDLAKPHEVHALALADMWVSERVGVAEFLRQRRGCEAPGAVAVP